MNKLNNWIAEKLSIILISMIFFWFCVILDIAAFVTHPLTAVYDIVVFISQCVIQLLALPVLGITTDIATKKMMKLLQETHDIAMQSQKELHAKLDSLKGDS
jgi:hypothetical protein